MTFPISIPTTADAVVEDPPVTIKTIVDATWRYTKDTDPRGYEWVPAGVYVVAVNDLTGLHLAEIRLSYLLNPDRTSALAEGIVLLKQALQRLYPKATIA